MQKHIVLSLLAVFILSSCSSGPEMVSAGQNAGDPPGEEVSKITTPEERALGPEPVYLYPPNPSLPGADSPMLYQPSFESVPLKYQQAKKMSEILAKMMPEGTFAEAGRSDRLLLKCRPDQMKEAKAIISQIDKKFQQIMIESRMIEVTESGLSSLGVSWNAGAVGLKMYYDPDRGKVVSDSISATLNALVASGQARIIACPRISTVDNSEASVNIGSRIPYAVPVSSGSSTSQWAVQYIDAGVSLKITPFIGSGGVISVLIKPEVSSISEWRTTPAGEFPVISSRNAETFIRVRDGETIIIGGLIDETDRENISKVPFAGEVPLIRELFTKKTTEKSRTEVVFLITPHLM